jgi:hypothetical protein
VTPAELALLAVLLAAAEPADTGALVTLVEDGASVPLSPTERSQIAGRVEALMIGCAITSATDAGLFAGRSLAREWEDARAGSHVYVHFPKPLWAKRGGVRISEVVVGLQDPSFIGPELSRHGDEVTGHLKCNGHRALALMCAPSIRPHLLPGQAASCKVFDSIGEPRKTD